MSAKCLACNTECETKPVNPVMWFANGNMPDYSFWCKKCEKRFIVYVDYENSTVLIVNMLEKPDNITHEDWINNLWAEKTND